MRNPGRPQRQLLLLATTTGYQTRAFIEAAKKLDLSLVFGTDRCRVLEDPWRDGALPLRFENPEEAAGQIAEFARANPLHGIVALGDRPTPTAARACSRLGLSHHPQDAADTCRDKFRSRQRLRAAGLNVPVPLSGVRFPLETRPREALSSVIPRAGFPLVLKPLALSASRGVIRVDTRDQFIQAFERIRRLLLQPDVQVMREETSNFIQVESYVEGEEFAVEGLVDRGRLKVLAIFDKPDPLVGPFFEETIYVTPSRLTGEKQACIREGLERATRAFGLSHGPLHAELRINSGGIWILEIAARSIGGLCARALRFRSPTQGQNISLEELVIRLALGDQVDGIEREEAASGVMMIPIPQAGIFQRAEGVDRARATPGVEDVILTVKPAENLVPLPESSSYLGFIFARGVSPGGVERALRQAHQELRFVITPALPVI